MFGFNKLGGAKSTVFGNLLSNEPLFSSELLNDLFGFDKDTEIEDATLIDTYQYQEGNLTYEQKVYRLKNNSIYVETTNVKDSEIESLEKRKTRAIAENRFEDAAVLRDRISFLKNQK